MADENDSNYSFATEDVDSCFAILGESEYRGRSRFFHHSKSLAFETTKDVHSSGIGYTSLLSMLQVGSHEKGGTYVYTLAAKYVIIPLLFTLTSCMTCGNKL